VIGFVLSRLGELRARRCENRGQARARALADQPYRSADDGLEWCLTEAAGALDELGPERPSSGGAVLVARVNRGRAPVCSNALPYPHRAGGLKVPSRSEVRTAASAHPLGDNCELRPENILLSKSTSTHFAIEIASAEKLTKDGVSWILRLALLTLKSSRQFWRSGRTVR
jgi:hypothetical protein